MRHFFRLLFIVYFLGLGGLGAQPTTTQELMLYDMVGEPFRSGIYGAPWGAHEAELHGLPSGYDWYQGARPGAWMNREEFGAIAIWGQVYEEKGGSPEDNFRVQIRNLYIYYYENEKWTLLEKTENSVGGSWYKTNFDNGTAEGSKRSEPKSNGGGISITMIDGHNFHWWGSKWPRSKMPQTAEAIYAVAEVRLIPDSDPNVDLSAVRVLASTGLDYYTTVDHSAGPNERITSGAIARHRFISSEWSTHTMYICCNKPKNSITLDDYVNDVLSRPLPPGVYPTKVQTTQQQPNDFLLSANYPNPFNPATTIEFNLSKTGPVSLVILDVHGREVKTLYNGRAAAGRHSVAWDGTDDAGQDVSSGIYFYQLASSAGIETRTMSLIR
jgi:hypothetical protein